MHTATLLHDDVVDESDLGAARSRPLIWGNQASVLVGDYLLGQAFRMMVETGSLDALRVLSNAAASSPRRSHAIVGRPRHRNHRGCISAGDRCQDGGAVLGGGRSGRASPTPGRGTGALESYGRNLGIAFQLVDDALDYSGTALARQIVGDDFREGKITLPVILSFRRGTDEERSFWRRTLAESKIEENDLEHAIRLMKKHGAIDDTLDRARHYGAIARDALAIFRADRHTRALTDAIAFCIGRAS